MSSERVEWDLPASPHLHRRWLYWEKAAWGWWVRGEVRGESKGAVPAQFFGVCDRKNSLIAKCRLFSPFGKSQVSRTALSPEAACQSGHPSPMFFHWSTNPQSPCMACPREVVMGEGSDKHADSQRPLPCQLLLGCPCTPGWPLARPYVMACSTMVGGASPAPWASVFVFER